MKAEDGTMRTSWTLIAHLKNVEDEESWRQFYDLYRKLIVGVAVKAGLSQEEAEEVLQETMASVVKHIAEFEANPSRGSFRAWLMNMARWRIKDQMRKRPPAVAASDRVAEGTSRTPTVERVVDPREINLEGLCDEEWERQLMDRALKDLQREVKADHYQIFHLLTVQKKSVPEVASMVGRNRAQVYLVKHRVANALKGIVRRLERQLG